MYLCVLVAVAEARLSPRVAQFGSRSGALRHHDRTCRRRRIRCGPDSRLSGQSSSENHKSCWPAPSAACPHRCPGRTRCVCVPPVYCVRVLSKREVHTVSAPAFGGILRSQGPQVRLAWASLRRPLCHVQLLTPSTSSSALPSLRPVALRTLVQTESSVRPRVCRPPTQQVARSASPRTRAFDLLCSPKMKVPARSRDSGRASPRSARTVITVITASTAKIAKIDSVATTVRSWARLQRPCIATCRLRSVGSVKMSCSSRDLRVRAVAPSKRPVIATSTAQLRLMRARSEIPARTAPCLPAENFRRSMRLHASISAYSRSVLSRLLRMTATTVPVSVAINRAATSTVRARPVRRRARMLRPATSAPAAAKPPAVTSRAARPTWMGREPCSARKLAVVT